MSDHRRDRVAHLLHHELARLLQREVADPRLAGVTITSVRITADLKVARVYFRLLAPSADPHEAQRALRKAGAFLRGQLGHALGMRVTPELRFEYDTVPDTARRVDALLDETRHQPEDAGAPEPECPPGRDDVES